MFDIFAPDDLASYLRLELDEAMASLSELANGIVMETIGTLPDVVPVRLKALALEVAARAYRNPSGYSSETIDDYTYRLPADTRHAGVYLTAAERAEIADLGGHSRRVYVGWLA